jgi:hypothetical protein
MRTLCEPSVNYASLDLPEVFELWEACWIFDADDFGKLSGFVPLEIVTMPGYVLKMLTVMCRLSFADESLKAAHNVVRYLSN